MSAALVLRRHPILVGLGLLSVIWVAGLVGFVAASGQFHLSMPRLQVPPATEHDVAAVAFGPTVRASSFFSDWSSHHHPLFLVDRRDSPTIVEKWASDPGDAAPWIEVRWREARDINRVVLRHGGSIEGAGTTARNYRLSCLALNGSGPEPALSIRDNVNPLAVHPLTCKHAWGVRVEFERPAPGDIVRIYELEAWGQ